MRAVCHNLRLGIAILGVAVTRPISHRRGRQAGLIQVVDRADGDDEWVIAWGVEHRAGAVTGRRYHHYPGEPELLDHRVERVLVVAPGDRRGHREVDHAGLDSVLV